MSIKNDKIDINGDLFTRSDYNGVSIIIHNKDGYINATKIANDNDKRKSFNDYIKSDKWNEICETYIKFNPSENSAGYENNGLYYLIKNGKREIYGTYVHPELIHFVAEWCNIEYAFKVNIIMNKINDIKNIEHKDGKDNLNEIIDKINDKIKFLTEMNNNKDNENKSLRELIQEQNNKIDFQTKQISELLNENKKQTKLIEKQSDKIDVLHEIIIDHDGRLTGEAVKNSKLLMIYKEPTYEGYNINDKDTYILPLRILRRQINNMRQPAKSIYENKEYLFATNLPEAINQNSSILNYIIDNEDIGIYFELENKGGKTKLNIDINRFLHDYYGDKLQNIKQKRINNKINMLVNNFVRYYKIKLNDETKIKLFKDFSDDEDIEED